MPAWQVFMGVFIGIFVGMLPWFIMSSGINPLPVGLLLIALFVNCHLGSGADVLGHRCPIGLGS